MPHQEGEVKWLWVAWAGQALLNVFGMIFLGVMIWLSHQSSLNAQLDASESIAEAVAISEEVRNNWLIDRSNMLSRIKTLENQLEESHNARKDTE